MKSLAVTIYRVDWIWTYQTTVENVGANGTGEWSVAINPSITFNIVSTNEIPEWEEFAHDNDPNTTPFKPTN